MELVALLRLASAKGYRIDGNKIIGPKGDLKIQMHKGYPYVSIRDFEGTTKKLFCYRLSAYQKFGEKMEGKVIRHADGDTTNFSELNVV
jgi:hypothetical protein